MTGAGRSTAAKELEDLGYYVVDNLPPGLLRDVVRLVDESRGHRAADRGRRRRALGLVLRVAPGQPGAGRDRAPQTLVFLDAADEVLVRRRRPPGVPTRSRRRPAARRPHPRAGRARRPAQRRRPGHRHVRGQRPPAHGPDRGVVRLARRHPAQGDRDELGFKYGIPVDADYVADMRFLPNPHWNPELGRGTGRTPTSPTTS